MAAVATTEVEPTPTKTTSRVDVTAVLANIDAAAALRDRIADLKKQYEVHAKAVTDALGEAVEGTDATGHVVVRYPHRSRHGLDKKAVQELLSDADFAKCSRVTNYRTLLFGED